MSVQRFAGRLRECFTGFSKLVIRKCRAIWLAIINKSKYRTGTMLILFILSVAQILHLQTASTCTRNSSNKKGYVGSASATTHAWLQYSG